MRTLFRHAFVMLILSFSLVVAGCAGPAVKPEPPEEPITGAPTLVRLQLNTEKVKKHYEQGQVFDPSGIVAHAIFSNDYTTNVTDEITIDASRFDSLQSGTYAILVKYLNQIASYNAVVAKLTGIEVSLSQAKYMYQKNENFSSENLIVNGIFDYSNRQRISEGYDIDYSTFDSTKPGFYVIIVSYHGFTEKYVVEVLKVSELVIDTQHAKTVYDLNEELSLDGINVYAKYRNDALINITDKVSFDTSNFKTNVAGDYEIIVSYENITASFIVTTQEANAQQQ